MALIAIKHFEEHMWRSAFSFSILNMLELADFRTPEFQNIESQHEYFFATPKPMKQIIVGTLNPDMLSISPTVGDTQLDETT